jgi:predicted metal-dependent peptidase
LKSFSKERILDEVTKTSVQFLLKEPFYGHFFSGMLREVNEEGPTLGVRLASDEQVKLVINPNYWQEDLRKESHRYGIIKHEMLHVLLKHIVIAHQFPFKRLFNIAADIVVNQYIDRDQLPGEPILLEDFAYLKLKPHQDVSYYYQKLLQEVEQRIDAKDQQNMSPRGNKNRKGKGKPADSSMLDQLLKEGHPELDRHRYWDEFEKMSAPERQLMEQAINSALRRSMNRVKDKGQGAVPSGLEAYLERFAFEAEPQFDWRRILRLFASNSSKTRIANTIRRPSKRYGTNPGIQVKHKTRVLVALDTSASIKDGELKIFFNELYHLWRQGGEILVVECDTKIQRSYPYKGVLPEVIKGRGGTAFDDPIRFANTSYRPDAIFYFTDGFGPSPEIRSRQPLLWVITPEGIKPEDEAWENLPGRKIRLVD